MKDNLLDEKFDQLIKEAGIQAILELEEECANEEIPKVEFSKEHEEKMKKFFAEYKAQFQNKNNTTSKVETNVESNVKEVDFKSANRLKPRKMIALAAATVAMLALGITTVGAWKGSLINLYLKDKGEYSDLVNGKAERSVVLENVYFGYVPADYEYTETKDTEERLFILFNHKVEDKYFYLEIERNLYSAKINTESGELGENVVNDKDVIYSEKDGLNIITWFENNAQNTLYTNDSKKELIKIAGKIEFLK